MEAVNKQDIIKGDPFGEIQKEIAEALGQLGKFDQGLKDTAKSLSEMGGSAKKTVQDIDAITKAEIESEKLLKQKIVTQQTETKLLIEKEKLKQASLRTAKAENSTKEKTLSLYQQESRKLNDLRNAYKNLAVQNKENTKEARALLAQITPLDAKLKAIDKTVGQSQRSVGNYGSALDNLKGKFGSLIGLASQFGLALGGVALVRGFIETFQEYENAVQSFRTIVSDLSDKDFAKFEGKISDVADTTKRSTIEIAESFENIAGLNADFAETADGLGLVSEAASTLSKASKDELGASTENLVGIMNQFDLAANQANRTINVLAAGQAVGASTITQSAEAYKNFGTVAKTSNITLEESQGLIQTLGKFSLFGAEAGTKLRGVTLQLQKANIGYASGQFDINDALVEFKKNLDSKATASQKDAYATKIFGAENITAGKILSNNIGLINKFTEGVTGTDEAQKAAAINSNTLTNRWIELKNSVTNMITTNSTATTGFGALKDSMVFVSNNLGTILKVLGQLIKLWIAYKVVTGALKLKESAVEWNNNRKAIKDTGDALKGTSENAKGFGNALKGIGFAVAISLATELVMKFWDIASGAEAARNRMDLFNKSIERGTKFGSEYVSKASEKLKTDLQDLELKKVSTKMSDEMYLKEKKNILNNTALKVRTMKMLAIEDLKRKREELARMQKQYDYQRSLNPFIQDQAIISGYEVQKAAYLGLSKEINEYTIFLKDMGATVKDNTIAEVENVNTLKETTKETKKLKDVSIDLDPLRTLDQIKADELAEINRLLAEMIGLMDESNNVSIDVDPEDVLGVAAYEKARAKLEIDLLNSSKTQEEINREMLEFEVENLEKRLELLKSWGIENLELEKEVAEKKRQLRDKEDSTSNKELIQTFETFQKGLTDILTEQIDARIAQLKREEDAAKSTQDYLQELAANGNINAQQSITEAIEAQREAQAEQARLLRTKQQIELISAGLSTFNAQLADGKKPGEALVSTGFVMQTLIGLLKNVQFFAKGTMNAPEGMAVVDEKGAEIITDKKGKIKEIGTGKGARFTHLNKGDKVYTANQTANILGQFGDIQNGQTMDKRIDTAGNSYDLLALSELRNISKAIKESGSSIQTEWGGIFNGVGEIVERKFKHGNIVTNRYRMKR